MRTLRLHLTGLDALLTALVGIPPIAWMARRIAAAYRLARLGPASTCTDLAVIICDGEILEEDHRG